MLIFLKTQCLVWISILGFFSSVVLAETAIIGWPGNIPKHLHPAFTEPADIPLLYLSSSPLVTVNDSGEWSCVACAEIPTFANNLLTYQQKSRSQNLISTWPLRKKISYADKTPVKPNDFLFYWSLLRKIKQPNMWQKRLLIEILDMKINAAGHLEIHHLGNTPDYFKLLRLFPVPSHLESQIFADCQENLECYQSKSLYYTNQQTAGLYSGRWIPKQSAQSFMIAPTAKKSKFNALELKPISARWDPEDYTIVPENSLQLAQTSAQSASKIGQCVGESFRALLLNLRNPALAAPEMRQAIFYGLTDNVTKVKNRAYTNPLRLDMSMFEHPIWYSAPLNRNKAEPTQNPDTLLTQLGWTRGPDNSWSKQGLKLTLDIAVNQRDEEASTIGKDLVSALNAFGISSKLLSENSFTENVLFRANFSDAAIVNFTFPAGVTPLAILHSREIPSFSNRYRGMNLSGWRNSGADKLMDQYMAGVTRGVAVPPKNDQQKILENLQAIVDAELPIFGLGYNSLRFSVSSKEFNIDKIKGCGEESVLEIL